MIMGNSDQSVLASRYKKIGYKTSHLLGLLLAPFIT